VKIRDALRVGTGTCTGGQMDWPGMLWTLVFPYLPRLPYVGWRGHAQLTMPFKSSTLVTAAVVGSGKVVAERFECTVATNVRMH